jgi:cytidylate kinase
MNYHYVDIELVQEIMNQYGGLDFKKIYDTKLSIWDRYSTITSDLLEFFKRVMLSIAKAGNSVIVGRGSFVSLGKYADVLDVMIYAPMDVRIKAIMEIRGISETEKAENYIVNKEKIRQSFIEQTYNVKWGQIDNFDMVFNTGKFSLELVTDAIVKAGKELENKKAAPSDLTTSDIKEDEVLDNTVKKLLEK